MSLGFRTRTAAFAVGALVAAGMALPTLPATAAPADPGGLAVYSGELTKAQLEQIRALGLDRESLAMGRGSAGRSKVEVILSAAQARVLQAKGVALTEKKVTAKSAARAAAAPSVFKPYSGADGLKAAYTAAANANPAIAKVQSIGKTVKGQDIVAVKVTKNARTAKDGARPAVLYISAQHAREWITPEMNRRLLNYYLAGYRTDPTIKKLIDTTELWFVPVSNPDGYDYTFTGDRLWRKNLRDNDGDGQIAPGDGVDLNRNYPFKWGYDNEGSSPSPASETYRGPAKASEPETKAMDGLLKRVDFSYLVNYHSAAELNLYGIGWQVNTPSPDDLAQIALAGTDETPAIPGYDPDISADLYTTNGETDGQAANAYGTLAFTPEMGTCESASAADPDDAFEPDDCESVFNFPDSEALVEAEFRKNIPFALSVARSAPNPLEPVSSVGLTVPDLTADPFTVSYGDPQTVAVVGKRSLKNLRVEYRIDGGPARTASVKEWKGGERYGDTDDHYLAEYRGTISGVKPGSKVQVTFKAAKGSKTVASTPFTYTRAKVAAAPVLVLANEDYEGVNPTYPPTVTGPKYAQGYVNALAARGVKSVVWDVSKQGVPHDLGVLDHFRGVVWYLGDNRLTQDAREEITTTPIGDLPDAAVARRQNDLTMRVRDYLNQGGKLVHTGETAAYYGAIGTSIGGIYYGLDDAPDQECVVTTDFFSDCAVLSDDFTQYYLGAYNRATTTDPSGVRGTAAPLTGLNATFGGPALAANPLDEAGIFTATSDVLPVAQFPLFRSAQSSTYTSANGAFAPSEGAWYAGAVHTDDSYLRLTRSLDLASVTAAQAPTLKFALDFDTEEGYDNVIVEARTAGQDDWTTLPDLGGLSTATVPAECEAGFLLEEHPFLSHYLTGGEPCTASGTTGSWNAFTGNSDGPQQVSFDLSAYAGKSVEVSVSYVTDPSTGGLGVTVDQTRLTVGGTDTQAEGFETSLGAWTAGGPPAGSPAATNAFKRSQALVGASITTPDSVIFGFGLEQIGSAAQQAAAVGGAAANLLKAP